MHYCHATLDTAHARKYLQQLCKHFAHKVNVDYDNARGRVEFPPGLCVMTADERLLSFFCQSEEEERLASVQTIIDSHILRFAWREELEVHWSSGLPDDLPETIRQGFSEG